MKIWVDADACPVLIKEIIIRAVLKREIHTEFVANKPISLPASIYLKYIIVPHGPDEADKYIVEHAKLTDLVISQDIPLAGILVPKGIAVISPHGTLFTKHNIGERLSIRNFLDEFRSNGGVTGGPKPFSDKDKQKFANAFDSSITRLLKSKT